jgi:hypothetical protein
MGNSGRSGEEREKKPRIDNSGAGLLLFFFGLTLILLFVFKYLPTLG